VLPADTAGDPSKRTPADNQTVRNVFIIDPAKKIRLILVYPMATGRNFQEILRVIDSMQMGDKHKVATPADWKQGDDIIITGAVSNEQAQTLFPGFKTLKPYLRTAAAPKG
jgi:alkyl hydroperoxide reductase subunit AhpC